MAHKYEDQLVGKTFEKCRIIAKLGTGGMGSVWLAEHFGLGRKVAVKILPPEMGRDPEYVARFMREATTAGRMEHPNIVQIHDVGYAEGRHFIVMQYVDGESLSTIVENLGAMDPKDAAKIAAGMLRGLQHAHEEGVVHRDVKPDNVLITKGDEPKLLDFGLAIETETALQITKDGMVVGTPYYLAPEQARGQKATPQCDVYAAGVTLYYLLTGKRPFVGATALAVLNKHIHEPPVPPIKHKPDIPKPLNDIVLKMMAKKPAERYVSAGAAADDLETFLKGKEVKVELPKVLPFGLDRLTKKQQILAASGAGGGLLLLVILLIVAFSGGKPAPPPAVSKTAPPPPPAESPEGAKLLEHLEFEQKNRENYDLYPEIFNRYENYKQTTASKVFVDKAEKARKAFYDFAEKRASAELDRLLKEPDVYKKVALLSRYPRTLESLTTIHKRLNEERTLAREEAEKKYLVDEKALDGMLREGKFKEASPLLDLLVPMAEGGRRERLERLRSELPRMEREFSDAVLRRVSEEFAKVHKSFEEAVFKRDNATAFAKVAKFVKDFPDDPEKGRLRTGGVNYEALFRAAADGGFKDTSMAQVRQTLTTAFTRADDSLAYKILTDLQDVLDIETLVSSASATLYALALKTPELRLATFNATGKLTLDATGFIFTPKGGVARTVDARMLAPEDLLGLAAQTEGTTIEKLFETNDLLCRAAGAAYLYSKGADRWAQAARWFRQAKTLGIPGLEGRLAGFTESGYLEVRERIVASRALLEKKNFDGAKQLLSPVLTAWSHDPVLKDEIGRAMASILVAEVLHYVRQPDYPRVKQAARALRAGYAGLYREEDVFGPYTHALRVTGSWQPAGNSMDDWTWEGKADQAPAPAVDEKSRGLKLKPDRSMELVPVKTKGTSGAIVELSVTSAFSTFAAGFKFDASAKDGRYRRLVVRDTGELTLYEFDGSQEKRTAYAPLGRKLAAGQWVELSFVSEGGDLACYVDQRPLLLVRPSPAIPTDRDLGIWASSEANFRFVQLRR